MQLEPREDFDARISVQPGEQLITGLTDNGTNQVLIAIERADIPGAYIGVEATPDIAREIAATIVELADELEGRDK